MQEKKTWRSDEVVNLSACGNAEKNFLPYTIVRYLRLSRNLVVDSFPDAIFMYSDSNLIHVLSLCLETAMEVKAKQGDTGVKLTLCKAVWQVPQNITNIPSAQGILGTMESHPLQYQLFWIHPHVYKNYYISIPA